MSQTIRLPSREPLTLRPHWAQCNLGFKTVECQLQCYRSYSIICTNLLILDPNVCISTSHKSLQAVNERCTFLSVGHCRGFDIALYASRRLQLQFILFVHLGLAAVPQDPKLADKQGKAGQNKSCWDKGADDAALKTDAGGATDSDDEKHVKTARQKLSESSSYDIDSLLKQAATYVCEICTASSKVATRDISL